MLRSLEQDRAKYAWQKIVEVKNLNNHTLSSRYLSYVERSATLILTNGLGNTLAFFRSKFGEKNGLSIEEQAYKILYNHLNDWFKQQKEIDNLLNWIVNEASSLDVFEETNEALALISWLKRFANAELKR